MKTETEIRAKLADLLSVDVVGDEKMTFWKVAACKTLLWALGENDDDRWWIRAAPGPAIDSRGKNRN